MFLFGHRHFAGCQRTGTRFGAKPHEPILSRPRVRQWRPPGDGRLPDRRRASRSTHRPAIGAAVPVSALFAHPPLRGQQRMGPVPHPLREELDLDIPVEELVSLDPAPACLRECHCLFPSDLLATILLATAIPRQGLGRRNRHVAEHPIFRPNATEFALRSLHSPVPQRTTAPAGAVPRRARGLELRGVGRERHRSARPRRAGARPLGLAHDDARHPVEHRRAAVGRQAPERARTGLEVRSDAGP